MKPGLWFRLPDGSFSTYVQSSFSDRCSPVIRAKIAAMLREEPVMSIEVFSSILTYAINGLMQIFDDFLLRRIWLGQSARLHRRRRSLETAFRNRVVPNLTDQMRSGS